MRPIQPTYVVVAPSYDDTSGGVFFLHRLADELCRIGERAVIWPINREHNPSLRKRLRQIRKERRYKMMPGTRSKLARERDLRESAIVVYPEIIVGNPLDAAYVVRWLMYPPSIRGTSESFGKEDLYFKVSDFSDDYSLTGGARLLHLSSPHPAYQDLGHTERVGNCYMMRKQAGKPTLHDPEHDICLDGLDHETIATHFNRCERFICYDEATMYSQLAALCGCISVVIPGIYRDRAAWSADRPIAKYGVAYGLDDISHALETRHLLSEHLRQLELQGRATVQNFVAQTKAQFGFS